MKAGKKLVVILAGVVALASVAFSGCFLYNEEPYLPEFESGYYRYAVRTMKDGKKEAYLVGFTELGLEQKYLILPEEFDGIKLAGLGYARILNYGEEHVGSLIHNTLKRLYIPFETTKDNWRTDYAGGGFNNVLIVKIYRSNFYFPCKGVVYGYNEYLNLTENRWEGVAHYNNFLANVSYMYNYEGAENEGYYWADSYDQTTIDFIPPEPKREGYTFGGWYKEPECINEWNFETDVTDIVLPFQIGDSKNKYCLDETTCLYAQWVKE